MLLKSGVLGIGNSVVLRIRRGGSKIDVAVKLSNVDLGRCYGLEVASFGFTSQVMDTRDNHRHDHSSTNVNQMFLLNTHVWG